MVKMDTYLGLKCLSMSGLESLKQCVNRTAFDNR